MLHNKPILIVEDDPLIAQCLMEAVESADGCVVGPLATVQEALALLGTRAVTAAILDANLEDRDVTPVALLLAEQGVPFVVHSGIGAPPELVDALGAVPVIMKPASPDLVVEQLGCVIAQVLKTTGTLEQAAM